MIINKYHFNYVCDLDPDRTGKEIDQHSPQSRYANRRNISLNRYGEGSFCRFRIPNCYARSGVYVVTVNE